MNQPRLPCLALLLALSAIASAQADSLLPRAAAAGTAAADEGCNGALRSTAGVGETRVIFHDGSHAPVSVPVTLRDDSRGDERTASTTATTTAPGASSGGGGGASPIALPSAEPTRPRSGPRFQTFLPGSLK